ncbi:hypothetical protein [Nocardioides sp.]|uniref:hypothetical protein n=1 Tax=Nocardioides sp. TaxID=35761 RepID=UPI002D003929|nr:hypothetical protein [Nocardioides sp.]HXH79559.1 hypothetical protein [Nocardioides sp.]
MAMKPLLVVLARQECDRHDDVVLEIIADRHISDAEYLRVLESQERKARVVNLAAYRGQLNAALARDIETDSYLSDLGMRAGVYGLENQAA